jgi:hypothetical protein
MKLKKKFKDIEIGKEFYYDGIKFIKGAPKGTPDVLKVNSYMPDSPGFIHFFPDDIVYINQKEKK